MLVCSLTGFGLFCVLLVWFIMSLLAFDLCSWYFVCVFLIVVIWLLVGVSLQVCLL